MAATAPKRLLVRQLLFLIAITAIYLCFELGFNARLLDVVGGGASTADVERLEIYGRTLSGIAAALVVLQLMLRRRTGHGNGPSALKILLCCGFTVAVVFFSIKTFVDVLVATRDAGFRRMATSSMLLQEAMVKGHVALDGLVDDGNLYAEPEGKAFMALFPFLALSNPVLEERLAPLKNQLIADSVRTRKPAQAYYDDYTKAMKETHTKWQKYARIPVANDEDLIREQDKAWNDYTRSLSQRGWTPYSVPAHRRGAVVAKVRKQVPVPSNWQPADEITFRAAVEQRYRKSVRGVQVGKDRVPPGLSYEQFVLRPGVQAQLRVALQLPPGVAVQPTYRTPAEFRKLYEAMVGQQVAELRGRYDAAVVQFEQGGQHYEAGNEAARAVIVPPVALFFSLLGAIGHLSKLLYLIATLLLLARSGTDGALTRRAALSATAVLLLAFGGVWTGLSLSDNRITRSELFRQMVAQVRAPEADDSRWIAVRKAAIANITHVVAVGQGHSYPLNETIRTELLQGMTYGYRPKTN